MIALPPTNKKPTPPNPDELPPTKDIGELVLRELMRDHGHSREEAEKEVDAFW